MLCVPTLFHTATATGLSFEQIGKAIGKDEVWVAAAFYGQVCYRSIFPIAMLTLPSHIHSNLTCLTIKG